LFAGRAWAVSHEVTSVEFLQSPGPQERTDHLVKARLEEGVPNEMDDCFGVIAAAGVVEHASRSGKVLCHVRGVLRPGG
jgi:hypothetical protein